MIVNRCITNDWLPKSNVFLCGVCGLRINVDSVLCVK